MIRTAALKDNSNLVKYIPTLLEDTRFEFLAEELDIKNETFEAMKMLENILYRAKYIRGEKTLNIIYLFSIVLLILVNALMKAMKEDFPLVLTTN